MIKHPDKTNQPHNRRRWNAHVKALAHSGLSRAEYCRQHELSYHALTYWCRKLRKGHNGPASTLVPVPLNHFQQTSAKPALHLHLPGKCSIEINDHFSEQTLCRLLAVLEQR